MQILYEGDYWEIARSVDWLVRLSFDHSVTIEYGLITQNENFKPDLWGSSFQYQMIGNADFV